MRVLLTAVLGSLLGLHVAESALASAAAADNIYVNGYVYSIDGRDSVNTALAVGGGRILFVGNDAGAKALVGPATKITDLKGRMLMPGLVDAHMHPLEGGTVLLKCNLNYERLTVGDFQARIQACLDQSRNKEPGEWLEVVNSFQQDMLPAGAAVTHETLDALKTQRPLAVRSSFGHSVLANGKALKLAHISAGT